MPLEQPVAADPGREAWHENFVEAIAALARAMPTGEVRRTEGVTLVRSGLAIRSFNCAFALDRPPSVDGLPEQIERVFSGGRIPWMLVTTAETTPALEPVVRALRLKRVGAMPGMVWEPLPTSPPTAPQGLEIRRIVDPIDARKFARTMMRGFEVDPGLLDAWAEHVSTASLAPSTNRAYYLGYVGGQPVCTAVRCSTRDIAGIYGVSTLPVFRRRGLGAAITSRAATDGREEGCRRSYLQSSPIGRTVYERIGYRFVEEYHLWGPDEGLASVE
jgi:GNAT superfamily N-acetyltransferase